MSYIKYYSGMCGETYLIITKQVSESSSQVTTNVNSKIFLHEVVIGKNYESIKQYTGNIKAGGDKNKVFTKIGNS